MTVNEFIEHLRKILQCNQDLNLDTNLLDMEEWDSLAFMVLIAFFDKNFGIRLTFAKLQNCDTVQDVISLANGNIN